MRKSDIIPAAELLESLADKFESEEIVWTQVDYGFVPAPAYEMPASACLIGGLAQVANLFSATLYGTSTMMASTSALLSSINDQRDDADDLRRFALARKAAAEVIRNRADGIKCTSHLKTVVRWNDKGERTLGDVVDVLKHAAKDLRNQASAT